ncbi:MAG: NADH-quinone oxidoreductase subunit L [Deltaproteobacteria bacterium]|nr:NADH-quinone oxidoreductase subunit L [Deltaproteobacteria bacterium]
MTPPADFNFLTTATALGSPFVAFLVIMIFTRAYPRVSATLSIAGVGISMAAALVLLSRLGSMARPIEYSALWYNGEGFSLFFGFLLDPSSLIMFALAAVICFLVQMYSLGYMRKDPGFSRYYAFQSLFAWSMLSLCVSSSLLQLYIFWEIVGLCSYLLIGFWYEKFSATQAGKKAFVMTRLGDASFFLGMLLLLAHLGNVSIIQLNDPLAASRLSPAFLTLSVLLIFGGVIGKSAQFPLLTWLPDAMEGPTPVSALLHSATMVAAGVFLFNRLFPFFSHSPTAMTVCLAVGTLSMLMAGTMAMVDNDIKKVWAYSTISQLGYMVMGLSAGSSFAGFFHLTTHATFKALLFLCSGVWIHYFETNDIYEIAKKRGRSLKIPFACTILAAASLSGFPPFSGFFSKEMVLSALLEKPNPVWFLAGLLGVFMTAYYAFRPIFIILFPRITESVKKEHLSKGPYRAMAWPLLFLAAVTTMLGFFKSTFGNFLGVEAPQEHPWVAPVSVFLAASGVFLTWCEFGRNAASQIGFVERFPAVKRFFLKRWFLDDLYAFLLNKVVYRVFAENLHRNDQKVIDGGIDEICRFTIESGRILSYVQAGRVRFNLMAMFLVLALVGLYFFLA